MLTLCCEIKRFWEIRLFVNSEGGRREERREGEKERRRDPLPHRDVCCAFRLCSEGLWESDI